MSTLAKIIRISMDNNSSANDGVCSSKGDLAVRDIDISNTICSSCYISKITGMAVLILWCPMFLPSRIEVWSS